MHKSLAFLVKFKQSHKSTKLKHIIMKPFQGFKGFHITDAAPMLNSYVSLVCSVSSHRHITCS